MFQPSYGIQKYPCRVLFPSYSAHLPPALYSAPFTCQAKAEHSQWPSWRSLAVGCCECISICVAGVVGAVPPAFMKAICIWPTIHSSAAICIHFVAVFASPLLLHTRLGRQHILILSKAVVVLRAGSLKVSWNLLAATTTCLWFVG